jgi:putative membrane protein
MRGFASGKGHNDDVVREQRLGMGGWIPMTVGMVLFWAVVITAVVLVIRYLAGLRGTAASPPGCSQRRAEDVLAERFARSEIDDEDYRQRLALLREHR